MRITPCMRDIGGLGRVQFGLDTFLGPNIDEKSQRRFPSISVKVECETWYRGQISYYKREFFSLDVAVKSPRNSRENSPAINIVGAPASWPLNVSTTVLPPC